MEKEIVFSNHVIERLDERGVDREEIIAAIRTGEKTNARGNRVAFRKNFPFAAHWKNRYYDTKQVMPVVVEENDIYIVVTVYAFYFGGPNED